MPSTHSFSILEIPATAFDAVRAAIAAAGPEYLTNYCTSIRIMFPGSEVALARGADPVPVAPDAPDNQAMGIPPDPIEEAHRHFFEQTLSNVPVSLRERACSLLK